MPGRVWCWGWGGGQHTPGQPCFSLTHRTASPACPSLLPSVLPLPSNSDLQGVFVLVVTHRDDGLWLLLPLGPAVENERYPGQTLQAAPASRGGGVTKPLWQPNSWQLSKRARPVH